MQLSKKLQSKKIPLQINDILHQSTNLSQCNHQLIDTFQHSFQRQLQLCDLDSGYYQLRRIVAFHQQHRRLWYNASFLQLDTGKAVQSKSKANEGFHYIHYSVKRQYSKSTIACRRKCLQLKTPL